MAYGFNEDKSKKELPNLSYGEERKDVGIESTDIGTPTLGASVTLPKGFYLLFGIWHFGTTGSGARNIEITIGTTNRSFDDERITLGYGNYATLALATYQELTETTTVYVKGASDKTSGSQSTYIKYVKLD